ncbi:MAG: dihydrolipoamide acetyltransferase family protein [Actinomycetota bacterium]|nr:dihydrolipoamide acetyltransferase family protein [Actinomycetota bacterium]
MFEVIMPKIGVLMETGKIEKWIKKEGDKVEVGDILLEIMTDKVSMEVEAANDGILRKILRQEGEDVPVLEVIAFIGEENEEIPEVSKSKASATVKEPEVAKTEKKEAVAQSAAKNSNPSQVKISPLAKKLAEEKGVDLSAVKGTGPGGRIVKEDILAAAESKTVTKDASPSQGAVSQLAADSGQINVKSSAPLKGIRKIIAEKMVQSKATMPHIILTSVACVDNLIALRERLKDKAKNLGADLNITDLIIKIAANTLREHIKINSSLQNENFIIYDDINIGLAVAIEDGLVVPTIFNTDKLGLLDIAKKRKELVEKAKQSSLGLDELNRGTFTISNLGMFGVRNFTAIINPPQAAILTVGTIYKQLALENDDIVEKSYMDFCLAVDHRIIDGADAAKYLQRFVEFAENPELLVF